MMNKIWKLFILITRVTVFIHLNTRGVISRFELINILCVNNITNKHHKTTINIILKSKSKT